jgi:hypothetical protein
MKLLSQAARRPAARHVCPAVITNCSYYPLVQMEEKLILKWLGGKNVNFFTDF